MIFALHAPAVFKQKSALDPSVLNRNSIASMLTITKNVAHGPLVFGTEKRHEPLVSEEKLSFKHVFSVQNTMKRRPFQSKTDGPDAMGSSQTSQGRDLANPGDFETLSL